MSNDVACVAVSDGGLTWFGSHESGLSLFNQGRWVLFAEGITQLPSNHIVSLSPAGSILWAGTAGGLAMFDGSSLKSTFNVANTGGGIPDNVINDILPLQDSVWCATGGGVSRGVRSGEQWVWEALNTGLGDLNVLCVGRFDGRVWVGSTDGTYEYQGDSWVSRGGALSWQPLALQEMNGAFYAAAGDSGVFVWQGGSWLRISPSSLQLVFRDVCSDGTSSLWCATSEGLVWYDGGGWQQFEPPGPSYNYVEDVSVSTDGIVWAATKSNSAAMRFDGVHWKLYDNSTTGGEFQDTWLFSVYSRPGVTWFGHCCCEFCRVDRARTVGQTETWEGFPFINSKHIAQDGSAVVWFSSDDKGIFSYDPSDSSYRNIVASPGRLSSNSIEVIAPVSSRLRWIGHKLAGVDLWDDNDTREVTDDTWRHFSTSDGLLNLNITSAAVAGERIYFGTPVGISVFHDTIWLRDYDGSDLLPASAQINDLAVDAFGNLWVATEGGAAKIEASGDITVYTYSSSGLVDNRVHCVAVDNLAGQVWFVTPNGISVLEAWAPLPGEGLADAYVYPNPFRLDRDHGEIRVGGLPSAVNCSVYDIAGKRLKNVGIVENGQKVWDGLDEEGKVVPTGVYLVELKTEHASCVRKVAVIR